MRLLSSNADSDIPPFGHGPADWDLVEPVGVEFLLAFHTWEASEDKADREAVALAYDRLLRAWAKAVRQLEKRRAAGGSA